jgi:hypothetical protein
VTEGDLPICLSDRACVCPSVHPSVLSPVRLVHPSARPSIRLSICLRYHAGEDILDLCNAIDFPACLVLRQLLLQPPVCLPKQVGCPPPANLMPCIPEMIGMCLILFYLNNRMLGPYLAAFSRALISPP